MRLLVKLLTLLKRFGRWFDHQFGGCFWEYPPRNRGGCTHQAVQLLWWRSA